MASDTPVPAAAAPAAVHPDVPEELQADLALAVELVTTGGELAAARQAEVAERVKSGHGSLAGRVVTDVDVEVERRVDDELARRRPDDAFLGEEFADRAGSSGLQWLLDPVDGTLNYVRDLGPWSCVLSAWRDGQAQLVAVWSAGRCWSALRGGGATLDGEPLRLPASDVEPGGIVQAPARLVGDVGRAGWSARVVDSSAIQVCQVADGRVVGTVRLHGDPRDLHGPALLVQEAGGVVTDVDGEPWHRASRGLVAARAGAHADLLRLARAARRGH